MSRHVFKLPDLGEGTVSAEIVEWRVKPGDLVAEDQPLVEMSTDKAVVEVPSPVAGRVLALTGGPGDAVAVGAELAVFDTGAGAGADPASPVPKSPVPSAAHGVAEGSARRVMASPATRRRAREADIDLTTVAGTGPGSRILGADFEAATARPGVPASADADVTEIPVIGIRRVIAQRMTEAKRDAPHFSYVEEVDVTALEALRTQRNARLPAGQEPLTYLPFVVAALVGVLAEFPQCNAHYDLARNLIRRYRAVHVGIATRSPDGLMVPVVRDAGGRRLWDLTAEIRRVTAAARDNRARREDLTGSTITCLLYTSDAADE